jgi:hypothetical protein
VVLAEAISNDWTVRRQPAALRKCDIWGAGNVQQGTAKEVYSKSSDDAVLLLLYLNC